MRTAAVAAVVAAAIAWAPADAGAQLRSTPIPHDVGQSVNPVFEGWYANDDGTFTMSFGYFNRNYAEALDIPVGDANRFEPGPADRGQPTHFLTRRQTGVFTVIVPADFADGSLTWSITAGGETYAVPGHLRTEWEIDPLLDVTIGNHPPEVRFAADGAVGQGPAGIRQSLSAAVGEPLPLAVWAVDDGVKKAPSDAPPLLGFVWSKYRGPGDVTFSDARPAPDADGRAETRATFSAPGAYVLRVLAWDDSGPQGPVMAVGFQCCWTNAYVDVEVQ